MSSGAPDVVQVSSAINVLMILSISNHCQVQFDRSSHQATLPFFRSACFFTRCVQTATPGRGLNDAIERNEKILLLILFDNLKQSTMSKLFFLFYPRFLCELDKLVTCWSRYGFTRFWGTVVGSFEVDRTNQVERTMAKAVCVLKAPDKGNVTGVIHFEQVSYGKRSNMFAISFVLLHLVVLFRSAELKLWIL